MANDGCADTTNSEHGFIPILHHFDFFENTTMSIHLYIDIGCQKIFKYGDRSVENIVKL